MKNSSFENAVLPEIEFLGGKKILAAFSGGKDSLAMLDFLNETRERLRISLYACHVNHGLRKEAGEDQEFCRDFCLKRNIPFYSAEVGEKLAADMSKGVEDAARRERYAALRNTASKLGCDLVLTAHTASDQLESFFIDLYTGASAFTLSGALKYGSGLFRPLLSVRTEQVEDYLRRRKLRPVYDRSNDDTKFVRNRVRAKIIPAMLEGGRSFESTVFNIQADSARLNEYFRKKTFRAVIFDSPALAVIDMDAFGGFEDMEKEYLLGSLFASRFRFGRAALREAVKVSRGKTSSRADVGGGYCFEVSGSKARLFDKKLIAPFCIRKDAGIASVHGPYFSLKFKEDLARIPLVVRNRRKGDRLQNGKKLKDAFIDGKIDLFTRDRSVIVEKNGSVLWAENIGADRRILLERFV